jgi:hypothetical protein
MFFSGEFSGSRSDGRLSARRIFDISIHYHQAEICDENPSNLPEVRLAGPVRSIWWARKPTVLSLNYRNGKDAVPTIVADHSPT